MGYLQEPDYTVDETCIHEVVKALRAHDTGRCNDDDRICLTRKDADLGIGQVWVEVTRAEAGEDDVKATVHGVAYFDYAGVCSPDSDCEEVLVRAMLAGDPFDGDYDGIWVRDWHEISVPWVEDETGRFVEVSYALTADAIIAAAVEWADTKFHPGVSEAREAVEALESDDETEAE